MDIIQGLSNASKQTFILPINQPEKPRMNLYYMESQLSWYFDIVSTEFTAYGIKLVLGTNLLRTWKNILPYGLAVFTTDERDLLDVVYLTDFSSGRVQIGILLQDEVNQVENIVYQSV